VVAEAPSGRRPSTLARSLAAGLVTLGGAAYAASAGTAGAVGAVVAAAGSAAAVPYAEDLGALVAAELRGKPQLLAEGVLAGARGVRPEITEEELSLELVRHDELRALMFRVLEAGRRTARPDKLRWLGVILGRVAVDRKRLDDGRVLIAALDDLEEPQIVVLQALSKPSWVPTRGWLVSELADVVELQEGVILSCIGTITRHGLGRSLAGMGGSSSYGLTDLGRAVLAVIQPPEPG
jgi:hypothetical protein